MRRTYPRYKGIVFSIVLSSLFILTSLFIFPPKSFAQSCSSFCTVTNLNCSLSGSNVNISYTQTGGNNAKPVKRSGVFEGETYISNSCSETADACVSFNRNYTVSSPSPGLHTYAVRCYADTNVGACSSSMLYNNEQEPSCTVNVPTPTPVPCSVTTSPVSLSLVPGGLGAIAASVTSGQGTATINQMRFGSYNTTIATVKPTSDLSSPYRTTATGVAAGSTAVWATADLSDGRTCQSFAITDTNIDVVAPTPAPTSTPTPAPPGCSSRCSITNLSCALSGSNVNISYTQTGGNNAKPVKRSGVFEGETYISNSCSETADACVSFNRNYTVSSPSPGLHTYAVRCYADTNVGACSSSMLYNNEQEPSCTVNVPAPPQSGDWSQQYFDTDCSGTSQNNPCGFGYFDPNTCEVIGAGVCAANPFCGLKKGDQCFNDPHWEGGIFTECVNTNVWRNPDGTVRQTFASCPNKADSTGNFWGFQFHRSSAPTPTPTRTPTPTPTRTPTPTPSLLRLINGTVWYDNDGNNAPSAPDIIYTNGQQSWGAHVTIWSPTNTWWPDAGGFYQTPRIYAPGNTYFAVLTQIPSGCTAPTYRITMPSSDITLDFPLHCAAPTPTPTIGPCIPGQTCPTIAPTITITPTPTPRARVTIQGRNVDVDGNALTRDIGQKITVIGPRNDERSSFGAWDFTKIPAGTYTVFADVPAGYSLEYSFPGENKTNNPPAPYESGNFLNVDLPNNGNYADIYFKYTPATCQVTTNPSSQDLYLGQPGTGKDFATIKAKVTSGLGSSTVFKISFSSGNRKIATVNPASDSTPDPPDSSYSTTVTGQEAGSTQLSAEAELSDGRICKTTAATDTDIRVFGKPTPPGECSTAPHCLSVSCIQTNGSPGSQYASYRKSCITDPTGTRLCSCNQVLTCVGNPPCPIPPVPTSTPTPTPIACPYGENTVSITNSSANNVTNFVKAYYYPCSGPDTDRNTSGSLSSNIPINHSSTSGEGVGGFWCTYTTTTNSAVFNFTGLNIPQNTQIRSAVFTSPARSSGCEAGWILDGVNKIQFGAYKINTLSRNALTAVCAPSGLPFGTAYPTSLIQSRVNSQSLTALSLSLVPQYADYSSYSAPGAYYTVLTGNFTANSPPPAKLDITYCQTFSISGNVFIDNDRNGRKNNTDPNYSTGLIQVSSDKGIMSIAPPVDNPTGGECTQSSNCGGECEEYCTLYNPIVHHYTYLGTYSATSIAGGPVKITLTVPPGYTLTNPESGSSFFVTVGSGICDTNRADGARCDALGNITDLNFGITGGLPWIQGTGQDLRMDRGFTSAIPSTAVGGNYASLKGSGGSPGLIFSGTGTPTFGSGQASENRYEWVLGAPTYLDYYTQQRSFVPTSYDYMLSVAQDSGRPITTISSSLCNGDAVNCDLTRTLPQGIYSTNGNLNLVGSTDLTFPANSNYLILVKGDLKISKRIHVPTTSTVTFAVKGNITVDKSIGETFSSSAPTIEGFYSTDQSFIAEGNNNDCTSADKRLNIQGSVIVNAALGLSTEGFANQRDLCDQNPRYPSVAFFERVDFIINAPRLIKRADIIYKEVAP